VEPERLILTGESRGPGDGPGRRSDPGYDRDAMIERSRPRRSPARYLAPLALAVTVAALVLVIEGTSGRTAAAPRTTHAAAQGRRAHHAQTARGQHAASTTTTAGASYTVKPGDSLSTISARTGVALPQLQSLNPVAASHPLQVGQRLKLRP
jgi:hypothetical protein